MRMKLDTQASTVLLAGALVLMLLPATCLAAKGGNGGGKPGGGDPPEPPAYPVSYSITKYQDPLGGYVYGDHNNEAAVVGWGWLDDETDGRRAMIYDPQIASPLASTQAFLIEDLVYNIPAGWRSRSAAGVNNLGAVVGNLEPVGGGDGRVPYLIRDIHGAAPALEILGPFDPEANETALRVNDSGDVVVWSGSTVTNSVSLFVGHYDSLASDFVKIDFASAGLVNPTITRDGPLRLSDAQGGNPARLVGEVQDGDDEYLFRVSTDGSGLEVLPIGVPLFPDEFGEHSLPHGPYWSDVNLNGDMVLTARVDPLKKGKTKSTDYAALWLDDTDEIVPLTGDDPRQVGGIIGQINDDGDALVSSGALSTLEKLWHGDWSATNGTVAITDLIDPNDPNKDFFTGAKEMTNRDATGWPTLITENGLILRPTLNASTSLAAASIPEPNAVLLAGAALVFFIGVGRVHNKH